MFQPLVAVLWYLMPFFIIAGIVKTPWFRGKFGEFLVNLSARCLLDKSRYHLIGKTGTDLFSGGSPG